MAIGLPGKKYNYTNPTKKKLNAGQRNFSSEDFPSPKKNDEPVQDWGPELRKMNAGKPLFPKLNHQDKEFVKRVKGKK